MGFSETNSIERKSRIDTYTEENNVKDIAKNIATDLSKLKKSIEGKETPVSAQETITWLDETWDTFAKDMDEHIENVFDKYVKEHSSHIQDLLQQWENGQQQLQQEFNDMVWKQAVEWFETDKKLLEKNIIQPFTFELEALKQDILSSIWENGETGNPLLADMPNKTASDKNINKKTVEWYHPEQDYIEAYGNFGYANLDKNYDIEDIYKDSKARKLRKIMQKIFDDEIEEWAWGKELRNATFNINLDKENGLAGLIIAIRESVQYKDIKDKTDPNYKYTLLYKNLVSSYDPVTGNLKLKDQETIKNALDTSFESNLESDENNKGLLKSGYLTYERKGGFDGEISKVAKILSRSQWKDLDTFASLVQSKDDIEMAMKEWNNALEMTWQMRNDKKENEERNPEITTKITEKNIFTFLCDFNGEWIVSAEYNKKFEAQQLTQGDVWPLFGQQVLFSIEQAIAVQEVQHPGEWEQIVIHNIIKNMSISNSTVTKKLDDMLSNQSACTRENLAKLINGYDEKGKHVEGNPEFKILFLDAIKKINGGSNVAQPDLYETLASNKNNDEEILVKYYESEHKLQTEVETLIAKSLQESQDPEITEMIRTQGLVRVRETCVTQVMNAVDHITITLPSWESSPLRAAGISKSWILRKAYEEVMQNLVQNLISLGIHWGGWTGIILSLGTGQEGQSESGRTKRARWAGAGINVRDGKLNLYAWLSGEIAEQYNYNNVINANLSQVHSAQYFGLEWNVASTINVFNWSGVEIAWGINRQKDPEIGINQINEQYKKVSEEIFTISSDIDPTDKNEVQAYIQDKIDHSTGKYQKFIESNKQHLSDNLAFIIRYMDVNNFFGANNRIDKLPKGNQTLAINDLLSVMQEGNMDLRRHNVVAWLHSKIDVTKLSFGVTSDMLKIQWLFHKNTAPNATATGGEAINEWGIGVWGELIWEQDKFWIFWFYAGIRLSTWRNMYVPNEQQYLYTTHEMGQGIGVDKYFVEHEQELQKDVSKYAAYLQALFNSDILTCSANANNTLQIQFNGKGEHPTIFEYLNIHATADAEKNFSIEGNILTIGNVWPMTAYTVTEAKWVRRILCLGTKKLDEAHRVVEVKKNTVEAITSEENGYKEWKKDQLTSDIINNMKQGTTEAPSTIESETAKFFDETWAFKKSTIEWYTLHTTIAEWAKFSTGTLTISKNETNKTYTVNYATLPQDKFTIEYIDEKIYNNSIDTEANRIETTTPVDKLFSFESASELWKAQLCLNTLASSIYELENTNNPLYGKFMTSASRIIEWTSIDDKELTDAIWYLQELLPNSWWLIDELKTYLVSPDRYTKTYIVDRLKQIFAKEDYYTQGKSLSTIMSWRTKRESISWPSGESLKPALLSEFKQQKNIRAKETYEIPPHIYPNLIGYTAFYRTFWWQQITNNYSITSLGNTTSQVELYSIKESNKKTAQDWFLNNLEKNQIEVEYLAQSLEKQFAEKGVSVKLFIEGQYEQTRNNINDLLSGKQLDKNQITIDSWIKISIDIEYVFYLLGECCNESIGANIKTIKIDKVKDNIPGKYSASWAPEKNYINGVNLYTKSHSLASNVITQESRVDVKKFINRKEKWPDAIVSSWETGTWSTDILGTLIPDDANGNQ